MDIIKTYQETCNMARLAGIDPVTEPGAETLAKLQTVVDAALAAYEPQQNTPELVGFYLYEIPKFGSLDSAGKYSINKWQNIAIIGLAVNVLEQFPEAYSELVLLHELCHLSTSEHTDKFWELYSAWEYNLFDPERNK